MTEQTVVRTTKGANDQRVKDLMARGWTIKTTHSQGQGYDPGKTCCLGLLFLPLALLGRKKDVIEYVLEKEEDKTHKTKTK